MVRPTTGVGLGPHCDLYRPATYVEIKSTFLLEYPKKPEASLTPPRKVLNLAGATATRSSDTSAVVVVSLASGAAARRDEISPLLAKKAPLTAINRT